MEVALKEEAEENRMPSSTDCAVNKYLDSGIRDELSALLNRISWNYGSKILAMQLFIKESYNYDRNGNRTQKITPYGTIDYTYNEENFLISSGWNGNTGVSYTYDKEGNLLTQESELKTVKYAYNSMNRIMYSEVTDKKEKTHSVSYYGYDAFGRRVIEQDKDEAALRSLYDGFTFDVIKQSPTFTNGLFVDSNEIGIRISRTGRPTGDRYRYLEDTPQQDGNRYFHLDEGNYRNVSSRYKGSRTTLSVNGTIAAQNADDDISYFTTDLLGSVRNTTDGYGYVDKKYTYDAFGAIIEGDLSGQQNFGYLGKQFDSQTGLYNYGYRDYTPKVARFTTVDPIRDGENWLTYCKNDSVNHVDLWGLEAGDQANGNLYAYAANNPVKYTDPDGCWIDNGNGSYTAEFGDTLYGLYGKDWQQKSGFNRDPRTLQVGETVGQKREYHDLWESISSTNTYTVTNNTENGQIMFGINLNFVGMVGADVSVGLLFDLDDPTKSGMFLSGGFAAGVSVGASVFGGYNSGRMDAENLGTLSVGYGPMGGNFSIDSNGEISGSLSASIPGCGIDAGFNLSRQHMIVLPFATEEEKRAMMDRYHDHH
ncbi:MAG: RHS repeat-associated core domain-containing protein, partial [Bacteroidales bacterium]|nr:RHS repeat-associated core domain-containing protein [Bacteroidales bacterium]